MADLKISQLTGASTPLAGTEVLPIVQSGSTKKVSVANLTADRDVAAKTITADNVKTSVATANLDISGTTIAASGSNTNVDVNINAKGTGIAYLNQKWGVNASGTLVPAAVNTYDIGNGTNNPRDVTIDRNAVLNAGTANGVVYLNGSKVLTSGTGLTFDGTKFGIDRTSPAAKLDVNASDGNNAILRNGSAGTTASPAYQSIKFLGYNATERARITGIDTAGSNLEGQLAFWTGPENGIAERMRINSDGYLLVGYTTSNGAYKLQVNSQIFATNATIATSDGRYKENVKPISDALKVINALNPVTFNWKQHSVHAFDTQTLAIGFIAQEVQQALSDQPYINSVVKSNEVTLPDETKEEFFGLAEGALIPVLVKALQEMKKIVDDQNARIAILEAK